MEYIIKKYGEITVAIIAILISIGILIPLSDQVKDATETQVSKLENVISDDWSVVDSEPDAGEINGEVIEQINDRLSDLDSYVAAINNSLSDVNNGLSTANNNISNITDKLTTKNITYTLNNCTPYVISAKISGNTVTINYCVYTNNFINAGGTSTLFTLDSKYAPKMQSHGDAQAGNGSYPNKDYSLYSSVQPNGQVQIATEGAISAGAIILGNITYTLD